MYEVMGNPVVLENCCRLLCLRPTPLQHQQGAPCSIRTPPPSRSIHLGGGVGYGP